MARSDSDADRWRRLAARTLVVLASVAIMLALVAAYARQATVDSDQFANRATDALSDDSVRSLVAQQITDEVVLKNQADLLAARPIIESVASEIVGGRAFLGLWRTAVRDVHRALFKRDQSTVTLTIADVGTVLAAALQEVRPSLARELRSTERVEVVREDIGSLSATLANVSERVQILAILLILLSLAFVAGALYLAPDRRDTRHRAGPGRGRCRRRPDRGLLDRPLLGHGQPRDAGGAGGRARGLGRLSRRPAHRGLDPCRRRRRRGGCGVLAGQAAAVRPAAPGRGRLAGARARGPARPRASRGGIHRGRRVRPRGPHRRAHAAAERAGDLPDLRGRGRDPAARLQPEEHAERRRAPAPRAAGRPSPGRGRRDPRGA